MGVGTSGLERRTSCRCRTGLVTALNALDTFGELDGKVILIDGAGGAVGAAAAAFALAAGARVIGTASPANHHRLLALGATPIAYGDGLIDRVRDLAHDGVDFALDAAGAGSLPQLIDLTGSADRVVTVADHQRAGELGVRSVNAANDSALLSRAAAIAGAGGYTPHVAEVVPITEAAAGHTRSEARSGKVVVQVARQHP